MFLWKFLTMEMHNAHVCVDPISFLTLEKVMEDSDNVCDLELLFQKHAIVFEVKSEQALVLHTSKRRRYR